MGRFVQGNIELSKPDTLAASIRQKDHFGRNLIYNPSRLAAYAPVGCNRVPVLPARALATLSMSARSIEQSGVGEGHHTNPQATRRMVFAVAILESALSTAGREPESGKSKAEKTQPCPRFLIRVSIACSIGFDTFT